MGRREPCSNEGEEVAVDSIKDMKCFKCICQVSQILKKTDIHWTNMTHTYTHKLWVNKIRNSMQSMEIATDSHFSIVTFVYDTYRHKNSSPCQIIMQLDDED